MPKLRSIGFAGVALSGLLGLSYPAMANCVVSGDPFVTQIAEGAAIYVRDGEDDGVLSGYVCTTSSVPMQAAGSAAAAGDVDSIVIASEIETCPEPDPEDFINIGTCFLIQIPGPLIADDD